MLTDLVRCTVLAEDLRQVSSHSRSEASTPCLGTTCILQQPPEKMRWTPCKLDLRDCTLRQVKMLMVTLEARSVVGLAEAEKRGGGDEEDPMEDMPDGGRILRITAIKNRL